MSRLACDLSIELPHVYLRDLNSNNAVTALKFARSWIDPLVARMSEAGNSVSLCIMIDDYFYKESDPVSPNEAVEIYKLAADKAGVELHHIVFEGALSETAETLLSLIAEEPREGAGSRGGQILEPVTKAGWLSNGDAMRQNFAPDDEKMGTKWMGAASRVSKSYYEHSIYLDTQLYDEKDQQRRYACPTLAAWWQLVRLGIDREENGKLRVPSGTISDKAAPPLFAKRTLSFLDPKFLQVEHSVSDILRQTFIPDNRLSILKGKSKKEQALSIEDRISYIFANPDAFSGW